MKRKEEDSPRIKLCGLSRGEDIQAANALQPDYIGFVFAPPSRRYLSPEGARELRKTLDPRIQAVGVFVDEREERIASLLEEGIIDLAQLHGNEDEAYILRLRTLTKKPLIQAFRVQTYQDIQKAQESSADFILLDSGAGTGKVLDWTLAAKCERPFFLAGGLCPENVGQAIQTLHPFGVDVSSGIETEGRKDAGKMAAFVKAAQAAF